jgi:hypothetical protein
MKNVTIKNTQICQEQGAEFYEKWFSQKKREKFITHVDTLYFMVTPQIENYKKHVGWQNFLQYLEQHKKVADETRESIGIFQNIVPDLETRPFTSAMMYALHFGLKDNFDIFVCTAIPNKDTPPIMVQIRSNALWVPGMKPIFDKAYDCIAAVLAEFAVEIAKTQENRIDYAFHTNYTNNIMAFFPEKDLGKMFVGNFKRGRKDYNFHTHEDDTDGTGDRVVECDYFTLGRHKSNNVFFRAYNKTKEVIEMGQKQFFIPIWLKYGLINKFDAYIMRKAFIYGSYESIDKARCEFYCDYGTDNDIKREIAEKLICADTPAKWYTKRAKQLVPAVTIISNIEIQTKRKFYDRKMLQEISTDKTPRKNIYNIFEQMSEVIRVLTDDTLRFVKYKGELAKTERTKRPMADWWERLRRAQKVEIKDEWFIDFIHVYQHNLDFERNKLLTLKKKAKMGAYLDYSEGVTKVEENVKGERSLVRDFQKFFEYLNDNDFKHYNNVKQDGFRDIAKKLKQNELAEKKLAERALPKFKGETQLSLPPENKGESP